MANGHWRVKTVYYRLPEFVRVRERRLDSSGCLLYTWWYIFEDFSCISGFLRNVVRFPLRTVLYLKKTSEALGSTQSPTEQPQGLFPQRSSSTSVYTTFHLLLIPRVRISGAVILWSHTLS